MRMLRYIVEGHNRLEVSDECSVRVSILRWSGSLFCVFLRVLSF